MGRSRRCRWWRRWSSSSSARTSSCIGRTGWFHGRSCGSITPCIIPRKIWNGSRRRAFIRSNLFFGAVLADVVLLLAGISPNIFVVLGPITIAHSAFVHANLDWTLGPFKYVIADAGFPSLASHRRRTRRREELCRDFPGPRHHIRHVLHAGRRIARSLRHRRPAFPDELRRAADAPVQEQGRQRRKRRLRSDKRMPPLRQRRVCISFTNLRSSGGARSASLFGC